MNESQVVQEQVDARNSRDLERFLSFYHPDIVIEDRAGKVRIRGHDGLRGFYGPLFAQSPDLQVDVPNRIHVGSWVVDEEETTGMNLEGFPKSLHAAVIYQVIDGKIAWVRIFG
jgi:hypothetical protein